jgi:hypothetical protein
MAACGDHVALTLFREQAEQRTPGNGYAARPIGRRRARGNTAGVPGLRLGTALADGRRLDDRRLTTEPATR